MLETKITELTTAVIALTELIKSIEAGKSEPVKAEPTPAPTAPVIVTEITPFEAKAAVEALAPVMPAAPTFEPPCPTPDCPITDGKSLIDFVMSRYKELGAEKGAQIQGVLGELGIQNVNEVKPEQYAEFYAKVMAL